MFNLDQKITPEKRSKFVNTAISNITKRLETKGGQPADSAATIEWISSVLNNIVQLCDDDSLELDPPTSFTLSKEISAYTVQTIIRLLTGGEVISENGLYYLNDTGVALGLESVEIRNLLDDEFNKLRYEFTVHLKQDLDEKQQFWCALMLLKIIYVDGHVHPAEKTYFDIIKELLKGSQYSFEQLESKAQNIDEFPNLQLSADLAKLMLKYIVTIAMCDGEYVGQESEFIKKAALSLNIAQDKIDTILQPVASSFMVIESLFPRSQ